MFFGKGTIGKSRKAIRRILVVEDEPLVAFDNEHFLIGAGYTVVGTVDSHAHAVALIAQEAVDLVIADVHLAGQEDGVAVAAVAQERGIAVLFVTGACPLHARHLAYGCLAKPYSQRDLLASIEAVDMLIRGKKRLRRLPPGLSLFTGPPATGEGDRPGVDA
ncbi:response regulator [Sphingobium algorifonticola]|uniref:Response regulator n=1 Tax=Sphingobium algorifonticola TaxID=2008318 RepID=A0A437J725_9SPHN|nr:response regulator [Sphingobium algorifonticola]RVT40969.1 response regulator [Sphingobium algorifonticola]